MNANSYAQASVQKFSVQKGWYVIPIFLIETFSDYIFDATEEHIFRYTCECTFKSWKIHLCWPENSHATTECYTVRAMNILYDTWSLLIKK
ncbi:hypothetical protein T05_15833 [Trichinella murrelli]|uniref:Uncharacterized protein n=1 Tax=Trichinella murrelli TaxID=144512 RepID=A0A0V0TDL0_9BILA|nr:hypothetical protein T05_15833 [Trichinella murrelli]